ncbi:unnamed protein product [Orchesella dallaii]|uniref:Uncharacterized protein n=1 Tax=Orchesella dallaii TaxID=48710 RepID=A0ABP1RHA2_9HEXA
MERSQVCLELSADCSQCIGESCFFVQMESGVWKCVYKLAGLQDIMRVIAPHFPEYCDQLAMSGPVVSLANPLVNTDKTDISMFIWIFSLSNFFLLLLFMVGFWFPCRQHRSLYDAIEDIPAIVRDMHIKHNNYYAQLHIQKQDDSFSEVPEIRTTTPNTNPFLAIDCAQPIPLPPSQAHQEIEMEIIPDSSGYPSSNTPSSESSPEVMPVSGTKTQFGRVVNPPNFVRS